jgi:Cu2+-exporting ATPase
MPAHSASAIARVPLREPNVAAGMDAGSCFHCGAPNPSRRAWCDTVDGVPRNFCCAGCLAVAQTIDAAGLAGFYASRTESAVRVEAETPDEWTRWDETAAAAGLVHTAGSDRCEVALLLEGLTCGACVWLIETWLAQQSGVMDARINFANRRAIVAWNPDVTRLSHVLRAVSAIGYRAYPYDPARSEALARTERRALLLRMAVALLAMMQVMMFAIPQYVTSEGVAPEQQRLLEWASFVLTLPALVYSAAPFFRGAWRDVMHLRLGMDVPVALGVGAAFAASAWATFTGTGAVYYDSVTMFIALLLIARFGELVARQKAGAAIELVARQRPAVAERLSRWPDRAPAETIAAAQLASGDFVLVRPGSVVPADGEIVDGHSHVEEAMLTGESMPHARSPGDAVLAGSVNRDGPLVVRVHAAGEATRLASVLRLVERAASERPAVARLADRAAAWFVGGLLVLALGTALIWWQVDPARMLPVTVALLVVSCPCALSLATPAALAAAAGSLARAGVVLARSNALESLARVTHVVLDKTGTLTEGRIQLVACATFGGSSQAGAIALAAAVDARSEHPLARALREAAAWMPTGVGTELRTEVATEVRTEDATEEAVRVLPACDFRQVTGEGVECTVDGARMRVGRPDFVAALSGPMPESLRAVVDDEGHRGAVAGLGDARGWHAIFTFSDVLRPGAARLVAQLRALGITPVLLSGDRPASVDDVARALGLSEAHGNLTPDNKRDAIARLQATGAVVAMVGDGINDAPALAQAQVSISLGTATPLAQHTADVVIFSDRVERAATALTEARRTLAVIRENLAWAAAYNAIAIPAAAFGYVTPVVAAIGMSVSSLVVVANALRLTRRHEHLADGDAEAVASAPAPA